MSADDGPALEICFLPRPHAYRHAGPDLSANLRKSIRL